jgi:hypothetical protein
MRMERQAFTVLIMSLRRLLSSLIASAACLSFYTATAQSTAPQAAVAVIAQPGLTAASNWRVEPASAAILSVDQVGDRLAIDFSDFAKEGVARVLLAHPLPIPEGANGFSCVIHSRGGPSMGIEPRVIVEDANGVEFLYDLRSRALRSKFRQYWPNNHQAKPIRLYTPGLDRPVVAPNAGMNIWPSDSSKRGQPVAPLNVKGLQFTSLGFPNLVAGKPQTVRVFWGDFAFTQLNWRESPLYYSIAENEHYGEIEAPSIALGNLGGTFHGTYTVSWELRDRFDGPAVAAGGESFNFETSDPLIPLHRITFPVREKGTYWINVKRRWASDSRVAAGRIEQKEFRLDIVRGAKPVVRQSLASDKPAPYSSLSIAPGLPSSIFEADVPFVVPVAFWPDVTGPLTYRIEARPANQAEPAKVAEGNITGAETILFDLSDLAPGGYLVKAELLSGTKVVDRSERLLGRKAPERIAGAIPASVPSWQKQLSRPASFIRTQPVGQHNQSDPAKRWDMLRRYLDNIGSVAHEIEYGISWSDVELMPGVYDWTEMDRFLDYAQTKGLSVMLWPSFAGAEPDWIPAWFEEPRDEGGNIFNSIPYQFQGGRINYLHSEKPREAAFRFLRALALHCKAHPAVTGYYVLTEHPLDMAALGWFVGGSEETQQGFRDYARGRLGTLEKINKRWGTAFSDWSQIGLPPENASSSYRMDWFVFLREGNSRYLVDSIKELRKVDDHRLVQTYMGANTQSLLELKALGCMVADGGSQNPETFGAMSMGVAELGLQRRPEEVSVGNWSQHFPTQLDATLFTMLLGGGGNSNCKMFIPVNTTLDKLQSAPRSLDRFEKFIPIWNELRQARTFPRDVYAFYEPDTSAMEGGGTGSAPDVWDQMVAMESGLTAPAMTADFVTKGKVILLGRETMIEESSIGKLERYVKAGGTLIMRADSGRECIEQPGEDWALLRRFGFASPTALDSRGLKSAVPVIGDVFPASATSFMLREGWAGVPRDDEHVIAEYSTDRSQAAVTWRAFGKGRVVVIWATTIVPSQGGDMYPFLRDIARWAGATLRTDTNSTALWANLLYRESGGAFYGLVYQATVKAGNTPPAVTRVRWLLPEDGSYRVTELISGADLGLHEAAALKTDGLAVDLAPRAVAIFRMEKLNQR